MWGVPEKRAVLSGRVLFSLISVINALCFQYRDLNSLQSSPENKFM